MKKVFKNILKIICALLILILLSVQFSFSFCNKSVSNYGENFFKESIKNEECKLVNIAMLGAHDAFTSELSRRNGGNIHEGGITNNALVAFVAGGFVTRLAKAQNQGAKEMLYSGVRYFDARITKIEGEYYTFHGYLSARLEEYLKDIVDFLKDHRDEFVIIDINQYYTKNGDGYGLSKDDYDALFTYISTIKNDDGKSLLDYIYYDSTNTKIGDLRYVDIKGGVIILAETNENYQFIYKRDGDASLDEQRQYVSIYSNWINSNDTEEMLSKMDKIVSFVKGRDDLSSVLRVNQAQKTGFFTDKRIISSIFQWSLLDMAANFNKELAGDEERLLDYLTTLPILMVDNATSTEGGFNKIVIDILKKANERL